MNKLRLLPIALTPAPSGLRFWFAAHTGGIESLPVVALALAEDHGDDDEDEDEGAERAPVAVHLVEYGDLGLFIAENMRGSLLAAFGEGEPDGLREQLEREAARAAERSANAAEVA